MTPDPDTQLRRRIRAAAILTGHRGLEDLATALNTEGLSNASLRTISHNSPNVADKLTTIANYCADAGTPVPARWLLEGFDPADYPDLHSGERDRPAMMSDLAELEARITAGT
jgi:hypothetical protein